jgi:hypothetical protein
MSTSHRARAGRRVGPRFGVRNPLWRLSNRRRGSVTQPEPVTRRVDKVLFASQVDLRRDQRCMP